MKAIFFGTPEFAMPSLERILEAGIEVVLICTRPPRRVGRGRKLRVSPIGKMGADLRIPTISPERIDDDAVATISRVDADIFVVAAYGRFIPSQLLNLPRLGVVNVHPSLLPRHRGPSPVASTIMQGDPFTGVTIILLDEGMDSGPILARSAEIDVEPDIRAGDLTVRLFDIGAEMLPSVLSDLELGTISPESQDENLVTTSRLIRKSDGEIKWNQDPERIARMCRAYHPWPGTFTSWRGSNLKLLKISVFKDPLVRERGQPGLVSQGLRGELVATAGDGGHIQVEELQMEGRRAVDAREFLRGYPHIVGEVLGR